MATSHHRSTTQPVAQPAGQNTALLWNDLPEPVANPGRWAGRFLRLIALLLAVALPVPMSLPQPTGELTRLAGIPDGPFAPTTPPTLFSPPLAEPARAGQHYDVLVFGSAFSAGTGDGMGVPAGGLWTDHLRNLTGLSVGVDKGGMAALIDKLERADQWLSTPRLIILELSERQIRDLSGMPALPYPVAGPVDAPDTGSVGKLPVAKLPVVEAAARQLVARPLGLHPQTHSPLDDPEASLSSRIGTGLTVIRRALSIAPARDKPEVMEQQLRQTGLFSSQQTASTLFLSDDFAPWRSDQALLMERRHTLLQLQDAVEANSRAQFLLLVAPDKGSVYGPLLRPTNRKPSQVEAVLASDPRLHMVPLVAILRALANGGMVDLYAPNSSLWGAPGHQQAARATVATLERLGMVRMTGRIPDGIQSNCGVPCPLLPAATTAFGTMAPP